MEDNYIFYKAIGDDDRYLSGIYYEYYKDDDPLSGYLLLFLFVLKVLKDFDF